MRRKGHKVTHADHLTWRPGDPDRDVDSEGTSVASNYVVIVRKADCPETGETKRNGATIIDPEEEGVSQHVALTYSRTNDGYGPLRVTTRPYMSGVEWGTYLTRPFYWVEDGRVYRGPIRYQTRDAMYDQVVNEILLPERDFEVPDFLNKDLVQSRVRVERNRRKARTG